MAETTTSWLEEINRYRTAAGLAPVAEESDWVQGIQNHLVYLENTPPEYFTGEYASAHTENPASPYYTESGAREAGYSDLAEGGGATAIGAIDTWLKAPFHAIGMLRAQLTRVGFANDAATGYAGLDVIQGIDYNQPPSAGPILFPGPGMTTDLVRYGGELPDPLETCGWQGRADVGLPLIALLPTAPNADVSADLEKPDGSTASSTNGELCLVDEYNYQSSDSVYGPAGQSILQSDHAVLVIPSFHLTNGTYSVSIHQSGQSEVAWSFSAETPVPENSSPPTISGTARPENTLYANQGTWSSEPSSIAHYWMRCDGAGAACLEVSGPSDSYSVQASDVGHTLRVEERASNDGGQGSPALSDPTPLVEAAQGNDNSGPPPGGGSSGGSGSPGPGGSSGDSGAPGAGGVGDGTFAWPSFPSDGGDSSGDGRPVHAIRAPGRPGYRWRGRRLYFYWYAVPGAKRYRVTLKVGRRARVIRTSRRHVLVRLRRRGRPVRITLRAVDAAGHISPRSPVLQLVW